MRFIYNISFLIFAVFYNTSCTENSSKPNGGSGSGGDSIPEIKYSINLEDKYKVKTDGNNFYYRIPVGTKLIISSKRDNKPFCSSWNNTIRGGVMNGKNGNLFSGGSPTLEYTSYSPLTIIAKGGPIVNKVINGIDQYPCEDKTFHVEWAVFDEQELKPDEITSDVLVINSLHNKEHSTFKLANYELDNETVNSITLKVNNFRLENKTTNDKFIDLMKANITAQIKIEDIPNAIEVSCYLVDDNGYKYNPCYMPKGDRFTIESINMKLDLVGTGLKLSSIKDSAKVTITFSIGGVDSGLSKEFQFIKENS